MGYPSNDFPSIIYFPSSWSFKSCIRRSNYLQLMPNPWPYVAFKISLELKLSVNGLNYLYDTLYHSLRYRLLTIFRIPVPFLCLDSICIIQHGRENEEMPDKCKTFRNGKCRQVKRWCSHFERAFAGYCPRGDPWLRQESILHISTESKTFSANIIWPCTTQRWPIYSLIKNEFK